MSLNELKPEDMMRCVDCLHHDACKDWAYGWGIETSFPYEAKENLCEYFKPKALLREKDAEIERLQAEVKRYENTCGKLIVRDNGEVVGFIEGQEKTYISKEIARVLRSMAVTTAHDKAIDEFAERLKSKMDYVARWQMHGDKNEYFIIGKPFIDEIAKEMKGEKE